MSPRSLADAPRTELQLAETRLVKVEREPISDSATTPMSAGGWTGILQATDVAIVRQETMHTATEELMLPAPRYWLAPSLVALIAWITDNQPLAERALGEALNRDGNKTALFFALICRRAKRTRALLHWLERYFLLQNPQALDREVIVKLEALSNGVFGMHGPGVLPPGQLGKDPGARTGRGASATESAAVVRSP